MKKNQIKTIRLKRIFINRDEYDYIFKDENEAKNLVSTNGVADVKFEFAPYKWNELHWLRPKKLTDRQWDVLKILISAILGFTASLILQWIK